jgi:starch synthase
MLPHHSRSACQVGESTLRILIASSEVTPFSKTGGLADVCGALPSELARLGHDVAVVTPAYRHVFGQEQRLERTGVHFDIPIGSKIVRGEFLRGELDEGVPVYFVDQPEYFDRPELYQEGGEDYADNCERFVFFCRAALDSVTLLDRPVDLIHGNDWQCGLIPALLEVEYAHTRGYESMASLFTIHNMAYQGVFWHWDMLLTGLDWRYFNWRQMEFHGKLNLLKTGLVFANAINTVSQRYSEEICEPPLGCGLEGVLQQRRDVLSGILNGVDYRQWNPETDTWIPQQYNATSWRAGKGVCKRALQEELGLPVAPQVPLVGIIGRLASQKGWDLAQDVIRSWAQHEDVQWAILGTGDALYMELLSLLAAEYPGRVAVCLELSEALAHRIEAGADMFLMPSRFEPCGLNQLYSLKYGTVPIVRATGGLADTICDANAENLRSGVANGFRFDSYEGEALENALRRACDTYRRAPDTWAQVVESGMGQDWSWGASARKYEQLYRQTIEQKKQIALKALP